MNFKNLWIIGFTVFLLASCATSYLVKSDYEKGVDFSEYKTFQILKQKHGFPVGANPINKQRIDRAILKEMNTLNFDPSKDPDLLISWFIKVEKVEEVNVYHDYYGRWRAGRWVDINKYDQGTLIIDIIDRNKKQVVWHGTTSDRIYEDMPDVEEKINDAVHAMFRRFAKDAKLSKTYASK